MKNSITIYTQRLFIMIQGKVPHLKAMGWILNLRRVYQSGRKAQLLDSSKDKFTFVSPVTYLSF